MNNHWKERVEQAPDTKDDKVMAFLQEAKDRGEGVIAYVPDASPKNLTELVAAAVDMGKTSAYRQGQRATEARERNRLNRKIIAITRSLVQLVLLDENLRDSDPSAVLRFTNACDAVMADGALQYLSRTIGRLNQEQLQAELKEEHEASAQEQEKVRAEEAAKEPLDGVEHDLGETADAPDTTPA